MLFLGSPYTRRMAEPDRRLSDAYDVVRAAAINAGDAAKFADNSAQRAHAAIEAAGLARRFANDAAKEAVEARLLARRASISLGKLLDILDP